MKENIRLSRTEFVEILEQLKAENDLIQRMDEEIKTCNAKCDNSRIGSIGEFCYGIAQDEIVAKLLDRIMNSENKDVEYWIFELEYGREYFEGCIKWKGESVDVSTPGKLYDYMVARYEH